MNLITFLVYFNLVMGLIATIMSGFGLSLIWTLLFVFMAGCCSIPVIIEDITGVKA